MSRPCSGRQWRPSCEQRESLRALSNFFLSKQFPFTTPYEAPSILLHRVFFMLTRWEGNRTLCASPVMHSSCTQSPGNSLTHASRACILRACDPGSSPMNTILACAPSSPSPGAGHRSREGRTMCRVIAQSLSPSLPRWKGAPVEIVVH